MTLQVRDLIEHLRTFSPDSPLRFSVECVDSTFLPAEDYTMHVENGAPVIRVLGASVRPHAVAAVSDNEIGRRIVESEEG